MFKCGFTIRVWNIIYNWLGIQSANPSWSNLQTVKQWWSSNEGRPGYSRKANNSLQMFICWEIWNERNARVFRSKASILREWPRRLRMRRRLVARARF
uniref:Reverse transcriptase zinc-binding domain-containing protein n=1 Tax=Aegilops tauschii subsp. strangulata TaxID=200361 RepID=A0A453F3K7_AEGTS